MQPGQRLARAPAFLERLALRRADVEHANGDFVLRAAVFAEVFAAHAGLLLDDVNLAQKRPEHAHQPLSEFRVVVDRRRVFWPDVHDGHVILRHPCSQGLPADNPRDRGEHPLAHFVAVRAHRQLQLHFLCP